MLLINFRCCMGLPKARKKPTILVPVLHVENDTPRVHRLAVVMASVAAAGVLAQ